MGITPWGYTTFVMMIANPLIALVMYNYGIFGELDISATGLVFLVFLVSAFTGGIIEMILNGDFPDDDDFTKHRRRRR